MTTLCLCDVNEHDLRVFAEIAAAGRRADPCCDAAEARRATGEHVTACELGLLESEEFGA